MKTKLTGVLLFVLLFSSTNLFSQEKEIGKIFTAAEADSLYGKVIESYTIKADSLIKLIGETQDKVMFSLKNKSVIIAGDARKVLYPIGTKVPTEQELRVYSKSKVLELIATGRNELVNIEFREVTTTLSNGSSVLEKGYPCPPYCE